MKIVIKTTTNKIKIMELIVAIVNTATMSGGELSASIAVVAGLIVVVVTLAAVVGILTEVVVTLVTVVGILAAVWVTRTAVVVVAR